MAWNEPGGPKSPWNDGGDGPPDLDEVLQKLQSKFGRFFGGGSSARKPVKYAPFFMLLGIVAVLVWALWGFYIVEPAERVVILRLGVFESTTGPGIHWRAPLVDKKFVVDIEAIRDFKHNSLMLTEDENIVDIDLNIQYKIKDVKDYVLNVRSPDNTIRHVSQSALRQVVGQDSLDQVITEGRAAVALATKENMQTLLDNYGTGLEVTQVNMQKADPPQAVIAAFDDVIKAREDKVRTINQSEAYANDIIPKARGMAKRQLADAQGHKEKVIAESEGEAQRFSALRHEFEKAPEVTRRRLYIETVEFVMSHSSKVMIDTKGGNNLLYLPIEQLIKSGRRSSGSLNDYLPEVNVQLPTVQQGSSQQSSSSRRRRSGRSLR